VEQLGARMVERGHQVIVYCRSGHFEAHPRAFRGMQLTYLPAIRRKHVETLSHTALSALRVPPDASIICMGAGNAPVVALLERIGRRTVFNVDGADWQRQKWGGFARWYLHKCELLAARGRSILVADAESVQHYYWNEYRRATEFVAYGAEPPYDTGAQALTRFNLTPGSYALHVGRLVPENAAHEFLDGMALAKTTMIPVVVGDAPYSDAYRAHVRATAPRGTVFTGYQFGIGYQQLTVHAKVFVLAATVGGTHPVLVEQMAAGKCVLARDTASNREVLGDAGLLWTTPSELAECLRRVDGDGELRFQLGQAAAKRVATRYNWNQVTDRYLELCELVAPR